MDGTNHGYFKFIAVYSCALFEVSEMYFRYKEGRLIRRENPSAIVAPTEE